MKPPHGKPGALARGLLLFRREQGLSQEKFALRAGIGSQTVKRYELGAAAPSDSTLDAVAAGFGVRPSELLLKCARLVVGEEKRSPCLVCGAAPNPEGRRDHLPACSGAKFDAG